MSEEQKETSWKPSKTFIVLWLACWTLPFVGMITYAFRYDLGLKKPNFKAGDCVRRDLSDEFETRYTYEIILKVGKKRYQTLWYNEKTKTAYGRPSSYQIEFMDKDYEQVDCPDHIESDR